MGRVTVIGTGSWGTALAKLLGDKGHAVRMWSYEPSVADQINNGRENLDYLPGVKLPETVQVFLEHQEALEGAEIVSCVMPSHVFRDVMTSAAPFVPGDAIVLSATKGIEVETLERPSEILGELFPKYLPPVALSGPTFAREVGEGDPTAIVAACEDHDVAQRVQEFFVTDRFRVYTNEDVLGVELAAALKNIIALAAGIAAGIGYRTNSRAALITRALAEMTRLGIAMGAVGVRLGKGESLEDILASMKMVAEGVRTTKAARKLAQQQQVEMPIVEEVHHILFEGKPPKQATADLMLREPKPELWGGADAT
jgi:glycerol-3-phosphate dehydrogenase (NAD(P)+)